MYYPSRTIDKVLKQNTFNITNTSINHNKLNNTTISNHINGNMSTITTNTTTITNNNIIDRLSKTPESIKSNHFEGSPNESIYLRNINQNLNNHSPNVSNKNENLPHNHHQNNNKANNKPSSSNLKDNNILHTKSLNQGLITSNDCAQNENKFKNKASLLSCSTNRADFNNNDNESIENLYRKKIEKLFESINRLKTELDMFQEKESHYLSRLAGLEKENKYFQTMIEDKEKKIQELLKKSMEDKLKFSQICNEIVNIKDSAVIEGKLKDEFINKCVEILGEKKMDKPLYIDKSIQVLELDYDRDKNKVLECKQCEIFMTYCDHLNQKFADIEDYSKVLIDNNANLKDRLDHNRKVEEIYLKNYADIENQYIETGKKLIIRNQKVNELSAELTSLRAMLCQTFTNENGLGNKISNSHNNNNNNVNVSNIGSKSTSGFNGIIGLSHVPSSLKAIIYADKFANT